MSETPRTTLTDGTQVYLEHRVIDPATGMQQGYVVLAEEERAKGFILPLRRSYRHVGKSPPKNPLRDLTDEERQRYGFAKFEVYPEGESPIKGRYWTQEEVDTIGKGCGTVTVMGRMLAETCARDPFFYSDTFCVACKAHFPVGVDGEFVWSDTSEKVGT